MPYLNGLTAGSDHDFEATSPPVSGLSPRQRPGPHRARPWVVVSVLVDSDLAEVEVGVHDHGASDKPGSTDDGRVLGRLSVP
jgi:hypothetical protein